MHSPAVFIPACQLNFEVELSGLGERRLERVQHIGA
jgi:hypothetical protein